MSVLAQKIRNEAHGEVNQTFTNAKADSQIFSHTGNSGRELYHIFRNKRAERKRAAPDRLARLRQSTKSSVDCIPSEETECFRTAESFKNGGFLEEWHRDENL